MGDFQDVALYGRQDTRFRYLGKKTYVCTSSSTCKSAQKAWRGQSRSLSGG